MTLVAKVAVVEAAVVVIIVVSVAVGICALATAKAIVLPRIIIPVRTIYVRA